MLMIGGRMEILTDIRDARAGEVAAQQHAADPKSAAKNVIDEIGGVAHLRRAGNGRAEGSYDGNKARQNHRTSTIFLVKLVRAL
jgi:hypothetical protein